MQYRPEARSIHAAVASRSVAAIVMTLPRSGLIGLTALVLGLCAACSDNGFERQVSTPPVALDTVGVIDPGAGEPAQLRWQPETGDNARFEVIIDTDTVVQIEDLEQTAKIGPAAVSFEATVTDIGEAGEITTEYTVLDAGVPDGSDPQLHVAMKRLVGTAITDVVTATGLPISRVVAAAEPLGAPEEAQLDKFLQQLSMVFAPLPAEPVASAATWSFSREVEVQGVTWTRITTFELDGLEGGALDLDVRFEEYAEFQEVDPVGPTNLEGTITGDGELRADLQALPERAFTGGTELEAAIFTMTRRTGRTANETEMSLTSLDSNP